MNISKTNGAGIELSRKGLFDTSRQSFSDYFIPDESGGMLARTKSTETGGPFLPPFPISFITRKAAKVLRLSSNIMEKARLIDAYSIIQNSESIDFEDLSLFILLDNDKSGIIKIERYGTDLHFVYIRNLKLGDFNSSHNDIITNSYNLISKEFSLEPTEGSIFVIQIIAYLFFGEITSRYIKAHDSLRLNSYSRILNNTKTDIVFVDTLWRERISSEGFKVRGHFRLQPVGEGRSSKKLIWIEEYNKHGYNRRATIEIQKDKDHDPH